MPLHYVHCSGCGTPIEVIVDHAGRARTWGCLYVGQSGHGALMTDAEIFEAGGWPHLRRYRRVDGRSESDRPGGRGPGLASRG